MQDETLTGRKIFERVLFGVYAAWSVIAVAEIIGRKLTGASPFPGFLANHNGNIAVSGFIVPVGLVAAAMRRFFDRRPGLRGTVVSRAAPTLLVATAAVGWTVYFIVLEMYPIYARNVADLADLPGSIFGAFVGTYAAFRALALAGGCRNQVRSRSR